MRQAPAAILPSLLLLTGCSRPGSTADEPVEVETMRVSPSEISLTIEFSAVLEPGSQAFLVSPGGVLDHVAVCEGDSVVEGETVAVMSGDAAFSGAARAAQEGLEAAQTTAERAANEAARIGELHTAGAVSESELLGARAASMAARAAVDIARHARASAVALERSCILRAPFAGVVGSVRGRRGDLTSPGDIVAVVTGGGLEARLLVPERHLLEILPGMASVFTPAVREYPPLEGRVASVASSVDPLTGLVPVTVCFGENMETGVRPGVSGIVSIEIGKATCAVVIPCDAVAMAGDGMQVAVLSGDGTVDFRDVETGIRSGDSIQITSGIDFGEDVVIGSRAPLVRGATAVRVRP